MSFTWFIGEILTRKIFKITAKNYEIARKFSNRVSYFERDIKTKKNFVSVTHLAPFVRVIHVSFALQLISFEVAGSDFYTRTPTVIFKYRPLKETKIMLIYIFYIPRWLFFDAF